MEHLLREHNIQEVLDYGCGTQSVRKCLEARHPHIHYHGYDPAIKEYSDRPTRKYELVYCVDVMEHVEEEYVDDVLRHIKECTGTLAYFVISTRRACHKLPDGRNAHITIKPGGWWVNKLNKLYDNITSIPVSGDKNIARVCM